MPIKSLVIATCSAPASRRMMSSARSTMRSVSSMRVPAGGTQADAVERGI